MLERPKWSQKGHKNDMVTAIETLSAINQLELTFVNARKAKVVTERAQK